MNAKTVITVTLDELMTDTSLRTKLGTTAIPDLQPDVVALANSHRYDGFKVRKMYPVYRPGAHSVHHAQKEETTR